MRRESANCSGRLSARATRAGERRRFPDEVSSWRPRRRRKASYKNGKKARHSEVTNSRPVNNGTRPPMTAKEFERELEPLQEELVKLQEWVKATGAKICIVFEGRDAAGKGGTIKRITERVSPRVFRVMALPAPTEREIPDVHPALSPAFAGGGRGRHLRPRYNRAGVEQMGYATEEQVNSLDHVVDVERAMIASGIILIKYWLEVEPMSRPGDCKIASTMAVRSGS